MYVFSPLVIQRLKIEKAVKKFFTQFGKTPKFPPPGFFPFTSNRTWGGKTLSKRGKPQKISRNGFFARPPFFLLYGLFPKEGVKCRRWHPFPSSSLEPIFIELAKFGESWDILFPRKRNPYAKGFYCGGIGEDALCFFPPFFVFVPPRGKKKWFIPRKRVNRKPPLLAKWLGFLAKINLKKQRIFSPLLAFWKKGFPPGFFFLMAKTKTFPPVFAKKNLNPQKEARFGPPTFLHLLEKFLKPLMLLKSPFP